MKNLTEKIMSREVKSFTLKGQFTTAQFEQIKGRWMYTIPEFLFLNSISESTLLGCLQSTDYTISNIIES